MKQPTDPKYLPPKKGEKRKYPSGNEGRQHPGLSHSGYAWWKIRQAALRAKGVIK